MGNRVYHSALIILLLLSACRDAIQDCSRKAGDELVVTRQPGVFHAISVADRFDVEILQDSSKTGSVELYGPSDVLGGVETTVSGGKLNLRDKNHCKWVRELDRRLKVKVYVDSLTLIETLDAASVTSSDTLRLRAFKVIHFSTGLIDLLYTADKESIAVEGRDAGELRLRGSCGILVATLYETGPLHAEALHTDIVFVYHYGLNRADVRARDLVECNIENTGDVYVHQEPSLPIKRNGRGEGQVIKVF